MQALVLLICLPALVAGAEYAMKFLANSLSSVRIGNVEEVPRVGGPLPACRACSYKSDLCYPGFPNGSYPTVVNFTNLILPQQFITLETWVRFDELNSTTHLISATDGVQETRNVPAGGFRLGFFRGFPTFGVAITTTSQKAPAQDLLAVSGPATPQWVMGRWYHIAGTWDGIYRKLYVDGELLDAHKPAYVPTPPTYTTAQFALGGSTHCETKLGFSGALAEVRMWNVSRSQEEIVALMNQRAVGNETGLLGLWREVAGDVVQDITGNQPPGNATAVTPELLSSFPPPQTLPRWQEGVSPCVQTYQGSFCASVVNYPYFFPNNSWTDEMVEVFNGLGVLKVLASPTCYSALLTHYCSLWYPRCMLRTIVQTHQPDPTINYTTNLEFQTWVPMPVSAESCLNLAQVCKVEIASFTVAGLRGGYLIATYQVGVDDPTFNNSQCLGSWLAGGNGNESERGIVFPHLSVSTHSYGPFRFDVPFPNVTASVQSSGAPSCDYPFVNRAHYTLTDQMHFILQFKNLSTVSAEAFENSPYCVRQCPPAIMTPQQYVTYTHVTGGLALFSFLFSGLILLLLLRDPAKRKFPGTLMVLILASVMGLSFALSLSLFGGWDQYLCLNQHNDQVVQGESSLCDTQAVFIQFFLATTQGYWCAMCVFLYHVLKMKPSNRWQLFTLIPLIPAVISVIILAATGEIGLASSGNICWVTADQTALVWILYYAPGLLNIIFSSYIIVSYARNRKGFVSDAAFFRMLQITILLLIAAIFSISAESNVSANYSNFIRNSATYLRCRNYALTYTLFRDLHDPSILDWQSILDSIRIAGGFDASGDPSSCPSYDPGLNLGVFYVDQIVLASLGILVPFILLAKQVKKAFCYEKWTSTKVLLSGSSTLAGTDSSRSQVSLNSHTR